MKLQKAEWIYFYLSKLRSHTADEVLNKDTKYNSYLKNSVAWWSIAFEETRFSIIQKQTKGFVKNLKVSTLPESFMCYIDNEPKQHPSLCA